MRHTEVVSRHRLVQDVLAVFARLFPKISLRWPAHAFSPRVPARFLMMLVLLAIATIAGTITLSVSAQTPTVAMNDQVITRQASRRVGLNLGAIDYWDTGQILKNLVGTVNPGFEPLISQQIWALEKAGTTTSFTDPDTYDGDPINYWAGGTFSVVASQSGGKELGCTGKIVSNTGPNYPPGSKSTYSNPVITTTACAGAFSVGDVVIIKNTATPTPESWWENSQGGFWVYYAGGGKLLSDTTDLCATCGTQSLTLDASASGSSAGLYSYFDAGTGLNLFIRMNGSYEISFWAKAASGSPTLDITALRLAKNGFDCGNHTQALTPTWTLYTIPCTASEDPKTTPSGIAYVRAVATGGVAYFDNLSFQKTQTDPANTTVLRDEVYDTLKNFYNMQSGGSQGILRDWLGQNAETYDNWTSPDYAHGPTTSGGGFFAEPAGSGTVQLSLVDYLNLCKSLDVEPYFEVPVTITTQDAANLIEFLAGPSSSPGGARRAALGETAPWTSAFGQIHLSYCNECWNGSAFVGQSLPGRGGTPNNEYYYDYSVRAKAVFAAMRSNAYYSQSSFDLVMNAQTGVNYSMDAAIKRAQPDSIEIENYSYGTVSSFSTDAALWIPDVVETYGQAVNANDPTNFYQSVKDYQGLDVCGANASTPCNVNVYEFGSGTLIGSIDQKHLDYVSAGAGTGLISALVPLLSEQYQNVTHQDYFALTEFQNGALNGNLAKVWGITVDMGGATNNVRPQYLAMSLVNQSIIGPMYSCTVNNNPTYDFAGSPKNGSNVPPGIPAMKAVPYLFSFCFENGQDRSMVLINTDLTTSHTVNFSGTHVPSGTVIQRQFAPTSPDLLNEAPSGTGSNNSVATVANTTSTLSNPTSLTLPPFSVTAIDFNVNGSTTNGAVDTPVFSPVSGTYATGQLVTITDSNANSTIYYTTDGSTPTTTSTVYNAPFAISTTENIKAIATAPGYTSSPTALVAYAIIGLVTATPTFSPAAGVYTSAQSVTISDSTAGSTTYYTTDGTTPTTASAVYSAPIAIGKSTTLKAMAVATNSISSTIGVAAYSVTPSSAVINFSSGFASASAQVALNGSATLNGSSLQLTGTTTNVAGSGWFRTPVGVSSFTTEFTFQLVNAKADGMTFVIANSPNKATALGGSGGALGYRGIANSVAIKFDLHNNAGEGSNSTGMYINGNAPTGSASDLTASGIDLHCGDTFLAHVTYDGKVLTLTLTDQVTSATYTKSWSVNIPSLVGNSTAYVGFTGATGGAVATQNVQTWSYIAQ